MENKEVLKKLKELEKDIRQYKREIGMAKTKNVLRSTLKYSSPFLGAAAFVGSYVAITGNVPFYRDYKKENAHTKTEYSSTTGKIKKEKQYEEYDDEIDTLCYYAPWELQEDGTYKRKVKTYVLEDVASYAMEKLVDQEDVSFESILADISLNDNIKKEKTVVQKIEEITEEEIEPYFEMTVYEVDKDDSMWISQDDEAELGDVMITILGGICTGFITGLAGAFYDPKFDSYGHWKSYIREAEREKECLQKQLVK